MSIAPIRLATPEEIQKIAETSDLTNASSVIAFEKAYAVVRKLLEVDPMHFEEGTPAYKKSLFIWGVENLLRLNGVPEFYFNVHVSDVDWIKTLEEFGAVRTSTEPEYRYKRVL